MDEIRKKPEDFLRLIQKEQRGKLKIYLGFAAGVGKTYKMLKKAHELKERGVDVVIGYVEPHERADTIKKTEGLEIIPPKIIEHKWSQFKEVNVDAIIKRKPTIALVDELAHANIHGSRNQKRYQDVEELLRAGISVITTMNIQHLESLNNVVEQAIGVKVSERVPDSVVASADLIVNIDIEAGDLIERLKAGKIYKSELINRALAGFFTGRNLTRLREIAQSEVANILDGRCRKEESGFHTPNTLNKVMVAVSGNMSSADALIRKALRAATHLAAPWYAVVVETEKTRPNPELASALELAKKSGAVVAVMKNNDIAASLTEFARENGITRLVMGRPKFRNGAMGLFQKSLIEKLLDSLEGVDILIG